MGLKIVATDGYTLNPGDNPWDPVQALGELTIYDRTAPEELIERIDQAEALIVNKTLIRQVSLAKLPNLRFITMSATGYDCVDIEAAGKQGVPVANVPIYGTDSVAQYVISAILNTFHNIGDHAAAVKEGDWTECPDWSFWNMPLVELRGKTIGIVGFGRIGRRVGELAAAFGMRVLAYDTFKGAEPAYQDFAWSELDDIFRRSDVVTLHCPLTPDNNGFIDADVLKLMKKSALLVNAARGPLVNETDLAQALADGVLARAVVDTVSTEPISADNPLLTAPNISITPHLAWATTEARKRLMGTVAENIKAYVSGSPENVVNSRFIK